MKILVIDRDQLTSQMISSRLSKDSFNKDYGNDIVVVEETVKEEAIARLSEENFDVIMVDPSPMKDAKVMGMSIRRESRNYCYIIVLGKHCDFKSAVNSGANNFITKPLDLEQLKDRVQSAIYLQSLRQVLTDTSEDFPSSGGVISKSAFNQLFLSALDRGGRYAEKSYILSVSIDNYHEIKELDGDYHATYGTSKLAHHLVRVRRQSDVIGQIKANEYSLLLQRTNTDTEAEDAAKRFAATLDEINDFIPDDGHSLKIKVSLMELPTGKIRYEHILIKRPANSI